MIISLVCLTVIISLRLACAEKHSRCLSACAT